MGDTGVKCWDGMKFRGFEHRKLGRTEVQKMRTSEDGEDRSWEHERVRCSEVEKMRIWEAQKPMKM
jgi:hypothetical protein